jgi:hypothetical protein
MKKDFIFTLLSCLLSVDLRCIQVKRFKDENGWGVGTIWKDHAEGKHKFFAWLLVQRKILTADKLLPSYELALLCGVSTMR